MAIVKQVHQGKYSIDISKERKIYKVTVSQCYKGSLYFQVEQKTYPTLEKATARFNYVKRQYV